MHYIVQLRHLHHTDAERRNTASDTSDASDTSESK